MRQNGKNNRQRGRGRRNGNGQINRNTTLDSNGPDVRLRGNPQQLHEKYVALGNDAASAGERIQAEAFYQYADHYFRVHASIMAASEERRERNQDYRTAGQPEEQATELSQDIIQDKLVAGTEAQSDANDVDQEVQAEEQVAI